MLNNIETERKKRKLTQEELANLCGVTRQTINAIENNKYDPTLKLAYSISKNLETTIEKMFKFED